MKVGMRVGGECSRVLAYLNEPSLVLALVTRRARFAREHGRVAQGERRHHVRETGSRVCLI